MPYQEFTTEELQSEEWRPVVGYEDRYSVSESGHVRSEYDPKITWRGSIIMRPTRTKKGYLRLHLSNGRQRTKKTVSVHALVAEAFIGPRPLKYEINHKDGNKANNHHSNLEYVTGSDNMRHAFSHGLSKSLGAYPNQGQHHPRAKLSESQVREMIRMRERGQSLPTIAAYFGVSRSHVGNIVTHRKWPHIV